MKKPRKMYRPAVFVGLEDRSARVVHTGLRVTWVVVARGPVDRVRLPRDNEESFRMAEEAFGKPQVPVLAPTTAPEKSAGDDLLGATLYAFKALMEKKK